MHWANARKSTIIDRKKNVKKNMVKSFVHLFVFPAFFSRSMFSELFFLLEHKTHVYIAKWAAYKIKWKTINVFQRFMWLCTKRNENRFYFFIFFRPALRSGARVRNDMTVMRLSRCWRLTRMTFSLSSLVSAATITDRFTSELFLFAFFSVSFIACPLLSLSKC